MSITKTIGSPIATRARRRIQKQCEQVDVTTVGEIPEDVTEDPTHEAEQRQHARSALSMQDSEHWASTTTHQRVLPDAAPASRNQNLRRQRRVDIRQDRAEHECRRDPSQGGRRRIVSATVRPKKKMRDRIHAASQVRCGASVTRQ